MTRTWMGAKRVGTTRRRGDKDGAVLAENSTDKDNDDGKIKEEAITNLNTRQ